MTANPNDPVTLQSFEAFLEVHGSNRSRWPAQQRLAFASLLASSADARRLLAEAEALDRLLDTMPSDPPMTATKKSAVVDRLMKAALEEKGSAKPAALTSQPIAENVIAFRQKPRKRELWPVGAIMAASLVLGLVAGLTATTAISPQIEIAAMESASETSLDPAAIALDDESNGSLGGDLL